MSWPGDPFLAVPVRHVPAAAVLAPTAALIELLDYVLDAVRWYAVDHLLLHCTLGLIEQVASKQPSVRARLRTHVQQLVERFEATSPQTAMPGRWMATPTRSGVH